MRESLLTQLARRRGIGDAYHDYRGELHTISLETKSAILAAMGCRVHDTAALEREIADFDARQWRGLLPAIGVLRPRQGAVAVTTPADQPDLSLEWSVRLEDGAIRTGAVRAGDLAQGECRDLDGRWVVRRTLPLPDDLPAGYHTLTARTADGAVGMCSLIIAPALCYEPTILVQGRRLWGISVQLYTVRSASNWGMGDFGDLAEVVRQCAEHGAAFVGLNPLHALFPSNPVHCSPYSPSSRHFLNVLYVAVELLPEYQECAGARRVVGTQEFQERLARLRAGDLVDYPGVAAAKLPVLRLLHGHFSREDLARETPRARAFQRFRIERGTSLRRHALHDAIDEHLRARDPARYWGWRSWPESLRDPAHPDVTAFEKQHADAVEFHEWLQWVADEQLGSVQRLARELGMPIGLYGDLAVGANPAGSETWSEQAVYCLGAGIGAPPDALALKGQDWGVPPQDPHALEDGGYAVFRDLIAANMRRFGALRLDHVMALFRQWWVPAGLGSTMGGYVHYPLEDLMSVLALESERHRCLVVGEDLGTVPDEVRHAMAAFQVYSYKVLLFEKAPSGSFRAPGDYERRAIASVTTHDLPTLRGFWDGHDLVLRDLLRLYPDEGIRLQVRDERDRDRIALLAALNEAGLRPDSLPGPEAPYHESLSWAMHVYLARSATALVVLQIEDLLGVSDPVNVPGTHEEYANWRRKLTSDITTAVGRASVLRLLEDVQAARSGS